MDHQVLPELLHHILSFLYASGNFSALKACSLTNHLFLALSQRLLFRTVDIEGHYSELYFSPFPEDFLLFLHESPHIMNYIKEFTMRIYANSGRSVFPTSAERRRQHHKGSIPHVVTFLCGLKKFAVSGGSDNVIDRPLDSKRPDLLIWSNIPNNGFQRALAQTLCTSSALTELDLTGLSEFPIQLVEKCPTLEKLSVGSFAKSRQTGELQLEKLLPAKKSDSNSKAGIEVARRMVFLNSLHVDSMYWWNFALEPIATSERIDTTQLHALNLIWDYNEPLVPFTHKLVNLKNLRISCKHYYLFAQFNTHRTRLREHERPVPDLACFPTLEKLTIHAAFVVQISEEDTLIPIYMSPISWIAEILEKLSNSSGSGTLSKLVFVFEFSNFEGHNELLELLDWGLLVEMLDRELNFPKLEHIEIGFEGLSKVQAKKVRKNKELRTLVNSGHAKFL